MPDGELRYPLIIQNVDHQIDEKTHALEIAPTNKPPQLTLEVFRSFQNLKSGGLNDRFTNDLEKSEETLSPFDKTTLQPFLQFATSTIGPGAEYWPESDVRAPKSTALPSMVEHARVTDTWVLFTRDRNTDFIVEDLEKLKKEVAEEELSPVAELIFSDPSDEIVQVEQYEYRGISNSGREFTDKARDLHFPKAFNDKQVSIINRLQQSDSCVVQGPTGTGKTHTIANIICHYLAEGKRVLVTSQERLPQPVFHWRREKPAAMDSISHDNGSLVRRPSTDSGRKNPPAVR